MPPNVDTDSRLAGVVSGIRIPRAQQDTIEAMVHLTYAFRPHPRGIEPSELYFAIDVARKGPQFYVLFEPDRADFDGRAPVPSFAGGDHPSPEFVRWFVGFVEKYKRRFRLAVVRALRERGAPDAKTYLLRPLHLVQSEVETGVFRDADGYVDDQTRTNAHVVPRAVARSWRDKARRRARDRAARQAALLTLQARGLPRNVAGRIAVQAVPLHRAPKQMPMTWDRDGRPKRKA